MGCPCTGVATIICKKKNRNKQYIKGEEKLIYDYKNQSFLSEHQTHFK